MEYKIVRSKRKTLAIYVTPQAEVEVRAPLRLAQSRIDAFVQQKQNWIVSHQSRIREQLEKRSSFAFGDTLPLLGKEYPVTYAECKNAEFNGRSFLVPQGDFDTVRSAVIKLYRFLAHDELTKRVQYYCKVMGLAPSAVKISSAHTRWGSCSGKNSLNFSWRLVLAHPDAVDYVVVHELAHIRQHNHSAAFWQLVKRVLPDYKRREEILKELHRQLAVQNWQ